MSVVLVVGGTYLVLQTLLYPYIRGLPNRRRFILSQLNLILFGGALIANPFSLGTSGVLLIAAAAYQLSKLARMTRRVRSVNGKVQPEDRPDSRGEPSS